jgi:ribose transport system permease protein
VAQDDLGRDPGRAAPEALQTGSAAAEARVGQQFGPVDRRTRISVPETAALFVVLVVLFVFFSLTSPFFFNDKNIIIILQQSAMIGMIAAPATLLLIAAQFDLSVGSIAGFTGMLLAILVSPQGSREYAMGLSLEVAIVIAMLGALMIGVINGVSVTVFRINALITTLGTLAIFRGLTRVMGSGQTIRVGDFSTLGLERFLGIPLLIWIFAIVVIAFWLLLRYTTYGRSMYAIGSSPTAARLAGIRTSRAIFVGFMLSAALAGFAGLILLSQVGAASNTAGESLMLAVITAVVLGGASLSGGRGGIVGTVLAVLIVAVLNNGLVQIGVQSFWIEVATGALLLVAVGADQLRIRLTQAQR